MLSLLLIFFASLVHAVIERLTRDNFHTSIFKNLDGRFWNRKVSFLFMKTFCGYPVDAWFFLQASKIIFISLSIVLYKPLTVPLVDLFLYIGMWGFNFDVFYTLLLRDQRKK